jgi:hypothetical protein
MDIKTKINQTKWDKYGGDKYYSPSEVPIALSNLLNLTKAKQISDVHDQTLYAIGNNHAGTYYPVVLEALEIIISIYETTTNKHSRKCAIEILTDIYNFFPEYGGPNGESNEELEKIVKSRLELYLNQA